MRYAIGIDVGGTKIAAGIVDLDAGQLIERRQLPTNADRGSEAVLGSVREVMTDLAGVAGKRGLEVGAVGLGLCEIVGPDGQLRSASLVDWRHLIPTSSPPGLPFVHLVSDVRAAALAEARFGAARHVSHALYVSIGTGIASVLLIEGWPYAGAHGAALVLASAARVPTEDGSNPVLEAVTSGPGLARQFGSPGGDARMVIAAAHSGDPMAIAIVSRATSLLGSAIAQLANCVDPALIVIGGGLGSAEGIYFESLKSRIEEDLYTGVDREIDIKPAALGAEAGLVGAALAATLRLS
jgi:glucokinase